jgi:hypothetical protein
MLEEKIETLTKEIVALRLALEAGGGTGTAAAKPAAKKAAAKKVEPEHDADEVGATMRKAAKKDKPAVQKYIKKQECEDLAELLTKPELFDAAFDFATGVLEAEEEDDDV